MTMPRLSIVTPTQGRPTLERLLRSGVDQLADGDEWLVVVDTAGMNVDAYQAIASRVSIFPRCRTLPHDAGGHDFGHSQLNYGIEQATGDWLAFNDDDDVFLPEACATIRAVVAELPSPRPLLFRFITAWGETLWGHGDRAQGIVREGGVGGHCLVTPRLPVEQVGRFGSRYAGDFDMIQDTITRWGQQVGWVDAVISQARPR